MALDLSTVVPIYQENIDALINQLGKNVTLYFKTTISNVSEEFDDSIREESLRKPGYKTTSEDPAPTETQNTLTIKALIQYNPNNYERFGIRVNQPSSIIRLKTFLTDIPSILRAEYVVPNVDSKDIIFGKYRLIGDPIPVGLQADRYAVSFWERV
jgi:hypothetical protein